MPNAPEMRLASPEDAAAIVALVNTVAAEDGTLGVDAFPFTPDIQAQFLAAADPLVHLPLVAVDGDRVVAYLHASRGTTGALQHVSSLAIVVARDSRGRGIGGMLLSQMANWAQVVGVRKLTLTVLASNSAAQRLFERQGYAVEGRRQGQFHLGGVDVDELLMARWLAPRVGAL